MRIDPETFDTIRTIFFAAILLFFVFVAINILAIQQRMRDRRRGPAPRPPAPGGTGEYQRVTNGSATHATFGTSGVGAGDLSPAGTGAPPTSETTAGDVASASWDSGETGGGDFSGGGGESGGGGSSGSWS